MGGWGLSSRDSLPRHDPSFFRVSQASGWRGRTVGPWCQPLPQVGIWISIRPWLPGAQHRTKRSLTADAQQGAVHCIFKTTNRTLCGITETENPNLFSTTFSFVNKTGLQISSVQLKTASRALKMRQFETIAYRPQGRYLVY